jgi:hypothetical protein
MITIPWPTDLLRIGDLTLDHDDAIDDQHHPEAVA